MSHFSSGDSEVNEPGAAAATVLTSEGTDILEKVVLCNIF